MAKIRVTSKRPVVEGQPTLTLKEAYHSKFRRRYKNFLIASGILNISLIVYILTTIIK